MASPELKKFVAHLELLYRSEPDTDDLTTEELVAVSRRRCRVFNHLGDLPPGLDSRTRIDPLVVESVPCEWVCAAGADPDRRLLWVHGGGWIACSPVEYRNICEILSASFSRAFAIYCPKAASRWGKSEIF